VGAGELLIPAFFDTVLKYSGISGFQFHSLCSWNSFIVDSCEIIPFCYQEILLHLGFGDSQHCTVLFFWCASVLVLYAGILFSSGNGS
jgi:hypothetical protein